MERVYIDMSQVDGSCVGVFVSGKEVVPVGTTAYSMPVEDRDEEYQRYADEYDIHFIFDDRMVNIDFFTVPWIDIMAWTVRVVISELLVERQIWKVICRSVISTKTEKLI